MTLKQSSAVHIQALVSADRILLGSSTKLRLIVINLASVTGRQLVNSPLHKAPNVVRHLLTPNMYIYKYITIFAFIVFAANSCKSQGLGCTPSVNINYIKSSCGLTNGIRFEELIISPGDSYKIPVKYRIKMIFECFNPGSDTVQTYWPKTLYFNKPNGHYLWKVDSTSDFGTWTRRGYTGEPDDSTKSFNFISGQSYRICPVKFKPNTWYFISFFDQRYVAYLFVDKSYQFKLTKFNLPTNF